MSALSVEINEAVPHWWIYHGIIMWTVFSVMMLIQIASHRYFRHVSKCDLLVHRITAGLMLMFIVVGVYMIYVYLTYELFGINCVHAYLAWTSITITLITMVLGLTAQRKRSSLGNKWNTEAILSNKRRHRVASYTLILTT
jgi:hypothetical protein